MLANRVGIIDHGHIVAEGTPRELKAQIGRPTVEGEPADGIDRARVEAALARFGESVVGAHKGVAVRLTRASRGSRTSCACSTRRVSRSRT